MDVEHFTSSPIFQTLKDFAVAVQNFDSRTGYPTHDTRGNPIIRKPLPLLVRIIGVSKKMGLTDDKRHRIIALACAHAKENPDAFNPPLMRTLQPRNNKEKVIEKSFMNSFDWKAAQAGQDRD